MKGRNDALEILTVVMGNSSAKMKSEIRTWEPGQCLLREPGDGEIRDI